MHRAAQLPHLCHRRRLGMVHVARQRAPGAPDLSGSAGLALAQRLVPFAFPTSRPALLLTALVTPQFRILLHLYLQVRRVF